MFSLLVPPSFTITPSDQTVTEKDQITFNCTATGNPVPNITWIKGGKTVATGETLSFEAKGNHSGKYWCSADNGIEKSINTSVSLDVQCKFKGLCTLTAVTVNCSVLLKEIETVISYTRDTCPLNFDVRNNVIIVFSYTKTVCSNHLSRIWISKHRSSIETKQFSKK